MKKTSILLLILCFNLNFTAICQNLSLKISGNDSYEDRIIDSIGYIKVHENYNVLLMQTALIQKKLYNAGYIENSRSDIKKENDTSFVVKMHLKTKYNTIYIYYNQKNLKRHRSGHFSFPPVKWKEYPHTPLFPCVIVHFSRSMHQ